GRKKQRAEFHACLPTRPASADGVCPLSLSPKWRGPASRLRARVGRPIVRAAGRARSAHVPWCRMDRTTLEIYNRDAAAFAADWHGQPPPSDLHAIVRRYFLPGNAADIGCGSGREVGFLAASGFAAVGYDASEALLAEARRRYPQLAFKV